MEILPAHPAPDTPPSLPENGLSVAERFDLTLVSQAAASLIEAERQVPVTVGFDTCVRAKVLDRCGMACTFCHNEGTPVAGAYSGDLLLPNPRYMGDRVSVFQQTNNVDFLPGIMRPDTKFADAVSLLGSVLHSTELHLTGGEPTLHPELPAIIRQATQMGYEVKMTSNGESGAKRMQEYAEAGLAKINFSIFGTTPEELAAVQGARFNNVKLATVKMNALKAAIAAALDNGIRADANIVMSDPSHGERVTRIINEYDQRLSVRILNDLDAGDASYAAVYELLAELGAKPEELSVEAGSSNSRVRYTLPNGRPIYFKQIRRTVLPETCSDCSLNNDDDCKEGYYGTRLYVTNEDEYKVGVCIQRMDLTEDVEDFAAGSLAKEIVALRAKEHGLLLDHYNGRTDT
jgi:GTP 3',8-cyclase